MNITPRDVIDHIIEGEKKTKPTVGAYGRHSRLEGEPATACALGAGRYNFSGNFLVCGNFCEYWDAEVILRQAYADCYGAEIAEDNDRFGRTETVQKIKNLYPYFEE